jgi:RimJ/RimL family protein N-acetyltransferase
VAWLDPIALRGQHAWLEPLAQVHLDALNAAAADGELWNLWYTSVPNPEGAAADLAFRVGERERGTMMPFVVRRAGDDQVIGATTFCNIDSSRRRLEIGYTWYAQSAQRTAINTEVKLMMLTHAFENLQVLAVEFRTHHMNLKSRAAIERLGAKLDGILRSHGIDRRGELRNSYVYSIIAAEWLAVKRGLEQRLLRQC